MWYSVGKLVVEVRGEESGIGRWSGGWTLFEPTEQGLVRLDSGFCDAMHAEVGLAFDDGETAGTNAARERQGDMGLRRRPYPGPYNLAPIHRA